MTNHGLVQQAFDLYMGIDRTIDKAKKYKGQENFVPMPGALKAGADIAVTAKTWSLAGGMPKFVGGEDIEFGKNVEKLKGRTAKNYGYTVTSLIRVSERTGLQGNGRIVKKIKESVDDFVAGKSNRIYVEDKKNVDTFFEAIIEATKNNSLDGDFIIAMMNKCNFKPNNISKEDYDELAGKVGAELQKHPSEQNINMLQNLILKKIYPFYPEIDVTDQISNKEEK
ncbi:MAG: hypothetical protein GX765_03380, partial [Candidatus Moranbacteria bacterium]|nr:hypothetical protein [Candidatus Moranbacteria bacterium]